MKSGTVVRELDGKTVLVTRAADQNKNIARLLKERGASVMLFPMIQFSDPDSWNECDTAIDMLARYDVVCFTSGRAVEKFIGRMHTNASSVFSSRALVAVGAKTKTAIESFGYTVAAMPEQASAVHLAGFVRDLVKSGRILFPRGDIARTELPDQLRADGFMVDEVVVYKTITPNTGIVEEARRILAEKSIDVATFFSPSSVHNCMEITNREFFKKSAIAVIGETTAEAARGEGLEVAIIAPQATEESMVDAIAAYFNKTR